VLLGAATPAQPGQHAVELGAGVGAAGLALTRRVGELTVTLVELDPDLVALARENASRNGVADRVRAVCLDVMAPEKEFAAARLTASSADHVLMNPPFNAPDNTSPERARRVARSAAPGTLVQWTEAAGWLLRPHGILTVIWRADGLGDVLTAIASGFGGIAVLPVHPKPNAAAIRVLVNAVKGSKAPLVLLPGLTLAESDNKPTVQAEAVLRHGAVLDLKAP
jgi:tRNA1(Val) A37 N6-methylase TrmN6